MSVLITGATGFVGSNLLRALLKTEKEIHILLRENSNVWRIKDVMNEVKVHYCNLNSKEGVKKQVSKIKPQKIFHLATYGGYPKQNNLSRITSTNFLGTANLLDACTKFDFDFFINTGTSSEYGIKKIPMHEEDILEPVTPYGITKAAATLYCQLIAKRFTSKIFTLRLFSPFGYFEDPNRLIPYVINNCLLNKELQLSDPNFVRDFVFVEDVIEAYFSLAKSANYVATGEIFNVGSGRQRSLEEIVDKISSLTNYCKSPMWGTRKSRPFDTSEKWEANIEKIRRNIKWGPKTSLDEGLKKTIKWFMNNSNLYLSETG
jgi:nucleoside-diphosphate-sugar epimerase